MRPAPGAAAAPAPGAAAAPALDRWFPRPGGDPDAPVRLFLFPYSGGGASVYRDWPGLLPAGVAGQCVQLPGRQERRDEAAFTEIGPLVEALREALTAELDDRPYAFFGHSMGALLAYRLAVAMERDGGAGPALVAASGWAPEGFSMPTREQVHLLTDAGIADWMRDVGSLPPEIAADREMLALAIPAMRADLAVCASYRDDRAPVRCPVAAYSGRSDPLLPPGAMASWSARTRAYLGNCVFPGGHFFLHEQALPIAADIARLLHRHRDSAG